MPDDTIKGKQTAFNAQILSPQQFDGLTQNPALGPLDPAALQSDVAAMTAGTTINPSTATITPWKAATKDTFTSATEVTIERINSIEDVVRKHAPIRYSSDGVAWKYGLIKSFTVNASTIDLVIGGIALTDPTTAFIEIGSADMLKHLVVDISGTMSVIEAIDGILNTERRWPFADSFIVETSFKLRTAASGQNFQVAAAVNNVANPVTQSPVDLGTSNTRVNSGVDIDESNYQIATEDNLLVDISQVGSGVAGSDLTADVLAVLDIFRVEQFIPVGAATPPLAFQWTGSFNNSNGLDTSNVTDAIGYFDFATSSGDALNRGSDVESRALSACCFDSTRSFNCGGQGSSQSNTISFIDAPSVSGVSANRGIDTTTRFQHVGVSGPVYGHICGGQEGTANELDTITSLLLPAAVGDAFNRGSLSAARDRHGSGFGNTQAICFGGAVTTSPLDDIFQFGVQDPVGDGVNRGNLVESSYRACGIGDKTSDTVFIFGGTTSNTSVNSFPHSDTIQSVLLTTGSGDALNRDLLPANLAGAVGNSGDTVGYISGGFTQSGGITGTVQKFTYTTGTIVVSNRGLTAFNTHGMGASM